MQARSLRCQPFRTCLLAALLPVTACGAFGDLGYGPGPNLGSEGSETAGSSDTQGPAVTTASTTNVDTRPTTSSADETSTSTPDATTTSTTAVEPGTSETTASVLDTTDTTDATDTTTDAPGQGCRKLDVLFVLDGSATMWQERKALADVNAFAVIAETLAAINGDDIDYRIGVTTDNDDKFVNPPCWKEPDPWINSVDHTAAQVAEAFECAVSGFGQSSFEAPTGCEHALTSAVDLLDPDDLAFVRDDALLVLVLLTDVDDYGAYDQEGGNSCGGGCFILPTPLPKLHERLVDVKDGRPEAIAAIVVAGDPTTDAGLNACNQPGSCNCDGLECDAYHGTRLYEFITILGSNGVAADVCDGPANVPLAVDSALQAVIAPACAQLAP